MKIRHKLLAGLMGVPIVFAMVAVFLIDANRSVQRDTLAMAAFQTKLEMGAAKLSAALITGQKAAEELMAEKRRALGEPQERTAAENDARNAEDTIKTSEANIDEILDSLTKVTKSAFAEAQRRGDEAESAEERQELETLEAIRAETDNYQERLNKYVSTTNNELDDADEVLNAEVEVEYQQKLLPLIQTYAAQRDEEVNKRSAAIQQSVQNVSRLVAESAIGATVLAVLIAFFLSRSFSAPLRKLTAAAIEVGKGRLASSIQIKSRDEIGLLARAFNQMARDLSSTTVSKDYVDGIIKSMGDSLVVTSPDERIITVNDATCRMLGYRDEELLGQPLAMLFTEANRTFAQEFHREGLSSFESTYLAKDGRTIPVVVSRNSMRLSSDQTPGIVCVAKDITEIKLAAEKIRQSEHKLSLHIQQTPLAVIEWNLAAEIVEWNPAAEAVFGYRKDEVLGQQIVGLLVPESARTAAENEWKDLLSQKVGRHTTYENVTKDGRTIICEWYNTPLESEGRVIGIASMIQDLTERIEMEEELKRMRDAALESARLKSEFLANMSHEIRTPMNGVIGMTGLLLDTELTSEQSEFAETIRSSGEALLNIINDILDFSKIEAGKLHFEKLDFDLSNAVESTIEILAERAHAKQIELGSLIHHDVPAALRGDPGRLRQVLTNLIGNSIKFTERGEVIVRVKNESETDHEVIVRFDISDTGIGVSEAAQQKLFNPFVQADGSTTRKYGGTGLGLAISRQLVDLMNGQIGVTSVEGQGSTFWFTARFEKQPAGAVVAEAKPAFPAGLRVLVVDDNETNRKILSHQLSSRGLTCEEADSGFRALELLRVAPEPGQEYNLAILDLMMPGMDGFELARQIKSDPAIAALPLVLLTSFGQRGDSTTAREAGVAAYLTKPIRQSQLFECLTRVISQPATSTPAAVSEKLGLITRHTIAEKKPMSNKLILIAEDNVVNQKVAVRQLQKLGYRADAVADGREALEALERIPYDLVLMDCQMPQMDGYEATAQIRWCEGRTKHTPIIAMTAHALEGDRAKCLAAGMDDYISKPVKSEELRRVLEKWLSRAGENSDGSAVRTESLIPPVDIERLNLAIGDEPDEMREVVDLYIESMTKNLKELAVAIAEGNAKSVELIAHNCAGTSANCGMTAVVDSFHALNEMGRKNELSRARAVAERASREFESVKAFLEENIHPVAA
jgi:PAS domain S-box-containing protein